MRWGPKNSESYSLGNRSTSAGAIVAKPARLRTLSHLTGTLLPSILLDHVKSYTISFSRDFIRRQFA